MKQQILIVLLVCFLMVNANPFMLIERYCANYNRKKILECIAAQSPRAVEIYFICLEGLRHGLSKDLRKDEIMCFETDRAEKQIFRSCAYGAVWLADRNGDNVSLITDACLRKFEYHSQTGSGVLIRPLPSSWIRHSLHFQLVLQQHNSPTYSPTMEQK